VTPFRAATLGCAEYRCVVQRRVIWVIGGWFVAAALLAAVATAGPVHLWHAPRPSADTGGASSAANGPAPPFHTGGISVHVPAWIGTVIEILALAAIVAVLAVLWRNRAVLPWNRRDRLRPPPMPPDVEATIAEDAPAQRAALRHGDARNAIVACWLRLEAAVEAAGVERRDSDTSTDLVVRVLRERAVDAQALDTLAALFREARFSSHTMDEAQREAALEALDRIHASMGVRLETAEAPG
jgi:hypothetical protein